MWSVFWKQQSDLLKLVVRVKWFQNSRGSPCYFSSRGVSHDHRTGGICKGWNKRCRVMGLCPLVESIKRVPRHFFLGTFPKYLSSKRLRWMCDTLNSLQFIITRCHTIFLYFQRVLRTDLYSELHESDLPKKKSRSFFSD